MADAPERHSLSGQRIAALGLLVNIVLAIIKFVAGWLGHSQALIADAVESMTDIGGSLIVLGGLRIASRPPDRTHPYGTAKRSRSRRWWCR